VNSKFFAEADYCKSTLGHQKNQTSNMAVDIHRENTVSVVTVPDTGIVAVAQQTTMQMGTPRVTGVLAFVRNTYPARYNHVVRNMNTLGPQTNTKDKSSMRGGHLLLYRYVILLAILLCFGFGLASLYVKPCAAVPFILSTLYIAVSIYNIVIYIRNTPLLHELLTAEVQTGVISGGYKNEFYKIPVTTTVHTGIVAALFNPAKIVAAVKRENTNVTEIQVMLYDCYYKRYTTFPIEIAIHLIVFIILFILAIAFVSTTITKPSTYNTYS
jgi:hypothetical protein